MKTFELKGTLRKETGKKESKNLRKQDLVPCVLYGGEKTLHFSVVDRHFKDLIYSDDVFLVKLNIDGETYNSVMKEIQFHPVSDQILHVDFSEVVPGNPVILSLPIQLTGNSAGMLAGGKIRQRRRTMKVRGLVEHMPEHLEVDITRLEIGDSMKVGDLEYENLEILDPLRAMIVGVVSSRLIAKGMQEALPEEEAEEGAEVVEGAEEGEEAGEEGAAAEEAGEDKE